MQNNWATVHLPADKYRVVLNGNPDYIHAAYVNVSGGKYANMQLLMWCSLQGYNKQKAYIIGEGPMESTVRNLLKVFCDNKCGAVIMLSNVSENGKVVPLGSFNRIHN